MIFRFERRPKEPIKVNCFFCKSKTEPDYKEVAILNRYISDRGKVLPRERTCCCQSHQKRLTRAIKRARHLALLPFVVKP